MIKSSLILVAVFIAPVLTFAQTTSAPTAPANPITASEKGTYDYIVHNVVAAAEKMPEEDYTFKPTPEVRSFGQLVGHVADANYGMCAMASGQPNPMKSIEKTKTTKAELVASLKEAVAFCNDALSSMTDSQGGQMVSMMGHQMAKLTVFSVNTAHTDEHYGNMVTYMRLKGIVPPSSETGPAQR